MSADEANSVQLEIQARGWSNIYFSHFYDLE